MIFFNKKNPLLFLKNSISEEILERKENKFNREKFICYNAWSDKLHISTVIKELRVARGGDYDLLN